MAANFADIFGNIISNVGGAVNDVIEAQGSAILTGILERKDVIPTSQNPLGTVSGPAVQPPAPNLFPQTDIMTPVGTAPPGVVNANIVKRSMDLVGQMTGNPFVAGSLGALAGSLLVPNEDGSATVVKKKRRKMNPLNPSALKNASKRMCAAKEHAEWILGTLAQTAPKSCPKPRAKTRRRR